MSDAMEDLLRRNRALIEEHRQNLTGLESGKFRIFAGSGNDSELTSQWIETYRRWISELEEIEAEFGSKDA